MLWNLVSFENQILAQSDGDPLVDADVLVEIEAAFAILNLRVSRKFGFRRPSESGQVFTS